MTNMKITQSLFIILLCVVTLASPLSAYAVPIVAPQQVDVVDSIVLTHFDDPDYIFAEWLALDPSIAVHENLNSANAYRLYVNWSDKGGTIDLFENDYFTFVLPDVFQRDYVDNVTDEPIYDDEYNLVAKYSIYYIAGGQTEVKITFTDYVNTHTDISGNFWCLLNLGRFDSQTEEELEFIINGEVVATGDITVDPTEVHITPLKPAAKYGYCAPEDIIDGYYVYRWVVNLNMDENKDGEGFNTLSDFSFEDIIPQMSPHVFITEELKQEMNIPATYSDMFIGEYTGSDGTPPQDRYQEFLSKYYYVQGDSWHDYTNMRLFVDGLTSSGLGGQSGLNVTDLTLTDKTLSAGLGTLTRPTVLNFYTISTVKLAEGSLGDENMMGLFTNTLTTNYGNELNSYVLEYHFGSGGEAHGVTGQLSFEFYKANENSEPLDNAVFSLYLDPDDGAVRIAMSDGDGSVRFDNLAAGTYYMRETAPAPGFLPNDTLYKVVLTADDVTIHYGDGFATVLEGPVINTSETTDKEPEIFLYLSKLFTDKTGEPLDTGRHFTAILSDVNGVELAVIEVPANGDAVLVEGLIPGETYTLTEAEGNDYGLAGFLLGDSDELDVRDSLTFTSSLSSDDVDGIIYITMVNIADTDVEVSPSEPPVSEPPVSEPPVSEPPVSEPPVTQPPPTVPPPSTEPPVTEPPVTELPETSPPLVEITPSPEPTATVPPVSEPPTTTPPPSPTTTPTEPGNVVDIPPEEIPQGSLDPNAPKTGDVSNTLPVIMLTVGTLVAAYVVWRLYRRKRMD